jgi:hypothetical protein
MTRITKEIGFKVKNGKRTETFYQKLKQETLEEFAKQEAVKQFSEDTFGNLIVRKSIEKGAKWQQEQIGKSEFLQKLRATISDAEARRLIFEQFKKK